MSLDSPFKVFQNIGLDILFKLGMQGLLWLRENSGQNNRFLKTLYKYPPMKVDQIEWKLLEDILWKFFNLS